MLALPFATAAFGAKKAPVSKDVKFTLYGTEMQVRFDASRAVRIKKASDKEVLKCVKWLEANTANTVTDCLKLKNEYNLCDWAYLKLLDKLAKTSLGNTNEATLLLGTLLDKSGYRTLIGRNSTGRQLYVFYGADAFVYRTSYFEENGEYFYLYGDSVNFSKTGLLNVIKAAGKPISFRIQGEQKLAEKLTSPKTVKSAKNPDFAFTYSVNQNLVDFYGEYPSICFNNDFTTRWSFLAEQPLEPRLQNTLVKDMKRKLAGKKQKEAIQQILWWVQTGFEYGSDEDTWGYDRAFWAEETLFYPKGDSEDRSVLFARLVRDVLGLKTMLVYYPNHLSTAVCITDEAVKGGYEVLNGWHYVICEPNAASSNVGDEMPTVKGKATKVIPLK